MRRRAGRPGQSVIPCPTLRSVSRRLHAQEDQQSHQGDQQERHDPNEVPRGEEFHVSDPFLIVAEEDAGFPFFSPALWPPSPTVEGAGVREVRFEVALFYLPFCAVARTYRLKNRPVPLFSF